MSPRSQKPRLEARIKISARKKNVVKTNDIIEELGSKTKSWMNVESSRDTLIEEVEVGPRREEDDGPSKTSGEKNNKSETEREEIPIELEEEAKP